MKETGFIKQNKEKWIEFEKILNLKKKDPDRLSSLFIQITDDLSYSRTFYPNRSVRVYLNNIAQEVFHSIYRNRRERGKRFVMFWKEELPQLVYESGRELRLSLIVFVISMIIGIVSCHNDPDFMRLILGDSYVEMTKENIAKGDPMAVYKSMHQVDMFLGIAFNNLRVAFITFLLGIFCGVGTMSILMVNGIMLGVFQYFFIQKGLFIESFLAVWLHGTLEISSIIIAGGAGLTLGKGLVFPGTYSRMESFQVTARRGFKLLMGVVPIIVFAAIIESFLTRYTDAPGIVRGAIILLSLVFILGYFVWYPIMKARKGFASRSLDTRLPPTTEQKIDIEAIKTSGEIFSDTFVFLKKHARKIVLFSAALAALYSVLFVIFYARDFEYTFDFTNENPFASLFNAFLFLGDLGQYFSYSSYPELMTVNIVVFSIMSALGIHLWTLVAKKQKLTIKKNIINFLKSVVVLAFTSLITWTHPLLFFLLLIGVYPIMMYWLFITQIDSVDIFTGLGRSFRMMGGKYFTLVGINLIFIVVSIIFLWLVSSPIVWLTVKVINMGLGLDPQVYWMALRTVLTFTSFLALGILFVMTFSGAGLFYYSSKEMIEAESLKQRIMRLGAKAKRAAVANEK